jgi:hypothetical protein
MSLRRAAEAPLSARDVTKILSICSPRGLLVGGQALAFWADHLQVQRPANLQSGVTADADFIGDAMLAKRLGESLRWETWIPAPDDATPQTGKVSHRLANGTVKQVDFLSGVAGLSTQALLRRAVELDVPGIGHLRVIHPVDVLDSRIQNLYLLPEKRTAAGLAQAALAIDVVAEFVRQQIASRSERMGLRLLERIVEIATGPAAVRVFLLHGIDPLLAVPLDAFRTTTALHQKRWPQIEKDVAIQRAKLKRLLSRRVRT